MTVDLERSLHALIRRSAAAAKRGHWRRAIARFEFRRLQWRPVRHIIRGQLHTHREPRYDRCQDESAHYCGCICPAEHTQFPLSLPQNDKQRKNEQHSASALPQARIAMLAPDCKFFCAEQQLPKRDRFTARGAGISFRNSHHRLRQRRTCRPVYTDPRRRRCREWSSVLGLWHWRRERKRQPTNDVNGPLCRHR